MPIVIQVGGPIAELLTPPISWPRERSIPKSRVADGGLMIGPGLIGRDQVITYAVLADVVMPKISIGGSLIDVRIQKRQSLLSISGMATLTIGFAVLLIILSPLEATRKTGLLLVLQDIAGILQGMFLVFLFLSSACLLVMVPISIVKTIRNHFR
jgi:hypothetical protein